MLFNFKTREWTELAVMSVGYPNWSHDGQDVYFERFGSRPAVLPVRIRDRKVEPVANIGNRGDFWTLTTWGGLTPDDSPLSLRDVSIEEIYALEWQTR